MLAAAAASLAAAAAIATQAWWLSRVLDGVFQRGWDLARALAPLLAYGGASLVRAAAAWAGQAAGIQLAALVKVDLRARLTRHLLRLGPSFAAAEAGGGLLAAATDGVDRLDAYFGQYLPQLAQTALLPLVLLAAATAADPLTGVVFLCTAPLIPLFMGLIGRLAEHRTRQQWQALSRMSGHFLDVLQGLATLKVLGRSRDEAGRMAATATQFRDATMQVLRVAFLSALALELLATLSIAIVAVEVGLRLLHDRLALADALFVLLLAPEFYQPFRQLGARFHAGLEGVEAAARIYQILAQPAPGPSGTGRLAAPGDLRFEGVTYTYPGRRVPAVEGVTFHLPAGRTAALVGATGAGKTTLAHLLLAFAEPQAGRIRVGDRLLSDLEPDDWRRHLAWVPQHPHLLNATLAENLLMARPDAGPGRLAEAVRRARLEAVVARLPAGYDTVIGEGGARLSGGEAQRLALARAYLRDAPVLILDEPTAQLDAESEAAVAEGLAALRRGRTALLIAHRLGTVAGVDLVVVLGGGRVLESGPPAELAARPGPYRRMLEAYGVVHG